jgi:hypothetical protein
VCAPETSAVDGLLDAAPVCGAASLLFREAFMHRSTVPVFTLALTLGPISALAAGGPPPLTTTPVHPGLPVTTGPFVTVGGASPIPGSVPITPITTGAQLQPGVTVVPQNPVLVTENGTVLQFRGAEVTANGTLVGPGNFGPLIPVGPPPLATTPVNPGVPLEPGVPLLPLQTTPVSPGLVFQPGNRQTIPEGPVRTADFFTVDPATGELTTVTGERAPTVVTDPAGNRFVVVNANPSFSGAGTPARVLTNGTFAVPFVPPAPPVVISQGGFQIPSTPTGAVVSNGNVVVGTVGGFQLPVPGAAPVGTITNPNAQF